MKTIITILLLTLSCQTFAQTLQDYIKAYEADCYTEVLDTTQICGVVKYDYLPAYSNDVLLHYKAVAVDTIWENPTTKAFKYDDFNNGYIMIGRGSWITKTEGEIEAPVRICKDYTYTTLKRKVYPFSEDFWNFVKNYKQ